MKAKFIARPEWYPGEYDFTVGEHYELSHQGGRFYSTIDNNCLLAYFENGRYYQFEITKDKPNQEAMTYRMNGIKVTKSFFEEKLIEVEQLKSRGVLVYIDFEVCFE